MIQVHELNECNGDNAINEVKQLKTNGNEVNAVNEVRQAFEFNESGEGKKKTRVRTKQTHQNTELHKSSNFVISSPFNENYDESSCDGSYVHNTHIRQVYFCLRFAYFRTIQI